jgi:hypothetical protein
VGSTSFEPKAYVQVSTVLLTTERLLTHLEWKGEPLRESIGTMLRRNTYHYWYHLGEAHAIRQMLGHGDLPQFVGDMSEAVYRPERPE